jgi:Holliday junction DNA helicase RuvA
MYDRLTGTIIELSLTEVILDVNGVGYRLTVPLSTSNSLPSEGVATLLTHLHVREDQLRLFGFTTPSERRLFRMLLGVSGIGPSIALAVLSGSNVGDFKKAVECADCAFLSHIKGIGRKTAERIVFDLRQPIKEIEIEGVSVTVSQRDQMYIDAALALATLGYSRGAAEKAVQKALTGLGDDGVTTEKLVRAALNFA